MHSQPLHTIPTPPEAIEGGINLDLEIGSSSCGVRKEEALFSPSQFHELLNQIRVYNRIVSGFMNQNCNLGVSMDLNSGRCRRTDGRKWRCSRSVVTGQKYCERHVHRGRQGSRKHVEPHANFNANKSLDGNQAPVVLSVDCSINIPQKCREGNPAVVNSGSNTSRDAFLAVDSALVKEISKSDTASTFTSTVNNPDYADAKKTGFGNANCMKISRRKQSVAKNNHHGFVSPGFGMSPKSVLHCGAGKVNPSLERKSVAETEQQRCRRTDGKKWQCRRDSVQGQKYCEVHMHRGAKRVMLNSESASNAPTTSTTAAGQHGINLNSVPASPQHTPGNNSTSSTSDATTVTDENISFCISQFLHNG